MIRNDQEFCAAQRQLERVEAALRDLHEALYDKNPQRFELFAEGYVADIARIRAEIDQYVGLSDALVPDLELRMKGRAMGGVPPPVSVLARVSEHWRAAVSKAATAVGGQLDLLLETGRAPAPLSSACDFGLASVGGGSVTLRLRIPAEVALFPELSTRGAVVKGLRALALALRWADASEPPEARQLSVDKRVWSYVSAEAAKLCPRPHSALETVDLSGRVLDGIGPVRFSAGTRSRLLKLAAAPTEHPETMEGRIRAVDLDKRKVVIRDRVDDQPDVGCAYGASLDDDVRRALDRRVHASVLVDTGPDGRPIRTRLMAVDLADES
ncbi:MAG: hypothetical protein FJX75_27890 [Armatimonadetes bacterium]|nr:hypothetical protein [Armatimonadota bacterium]